MVINFVKYQGTGNDFVLIDHRQPFFNKEDAELIAQLCDRRFGIGADGLILLEEHPDADFEMVYFNADGKPSSMCGNGGRCTVHYAHSLGMIGDQTRFMAVDGIHEATVADGWVALHMRDVQTIEDKDGAYFLDTGSPHHIQVCDAVQEVNVQQEGADIRYNTYGAAGANVNFVEPVSADHFKVRTYERGVEAETYSCGTGVTAVALAMYHAGKTIANTVKISTPGGELKISFTKAADRFTDVVLAGPATPVYQGQWTSN
ncbi:diaminopimelate epimerase [Gilvibacter sp.]|uniref:diaminopimelate epimerase n=1 Tax=Gilvibacter sp. TaxID=2729997 RepID=UPI0025C44F99|nr:diaminopimelate epimerase [Gilvibacter sp.]NQX76185.1 diaminopimelate epimerase [Gilvibacter sp.]